MRICSTLANRKVKRSHNRFEIVCLSLAKTRSLEWSGPCLMRALPNCRTSYPKPKHEGESDVSIEEVPGEAKSKCGRRSAPFTEL